LSAYATVYSFEMNEICKGHFKTDGSLLFTISPHYAIHTLFTFLINN